MPTCYCVMYIIPQQMSDKTLESRQFKAKLPSLLYSMCKTVSKYCDVKDMLLTLSLYGPQGVPSIAPHL